MIDIDELPDRDRQAMNCERQNFEKYLEGQGVSKEEIEATFKNVKCLGRFSTNRALIWNKWRVAPSKAVMERTFAFCENCYAVVRRWMYVVIGG